MCSIQCFSSLLRNPLLAACLSLVCLDPFFIVIFVIFTLSVVFVFPPLSTWMDKQSKSLGRLQKKRTSVRKNEERECVCVREREGNDLHQHPYYLSPSPGLRKWGFRQGSASRVTDAAPVKHPSFLRARGLITQSRTRRYRHTHLHTRARLIRCHV